MIVAAIICAVAAIICAVAAIICAVAALIAAIWMPHRESRATEDTALDTPDLATIR
jgi:hypothetical protein